MTSNVQTNLNPAQVESIDVLRAAIADAAGALAAKANGLRALLSDLDGHPEDASPQEVLGVMRNHNLRITETDRRLHSAVQLAAQILARPDLAGLPAAEPQRIPVAA